MAAAALASLKAAAADCAAQAAGFSPDEAASGLIAVDELRVLFLPLARTQGAGTAASAGVLPPVARQAVAADHAPLTLLQLPPEVLVLVFGRLDARSLALVAATCSELYRDKPRPMTPVEEALRERAAARGHVSPGRLPDGATPWTAHLAWLEHRRDEAWAPVAAGMVCSIFVAEGGRLMSCGAEEEDAPGVLGHGELDVEAPVLPTPTLLPSMAGIRIISVHAGWGFNAAVSTAGAVYTWGMGDSGRLGHGDTEGSLVPKQVQALTGHRVLSAAIGFGHSLAVTEWGEVFSWGWNEAGQCGHGSSGDEVLLPRRVEALAGVRARRASAGSSHSLVVTEEGALYSFGRSTFGRLGHGSGNDEHSPRRVDELRHVRIADAAAGGEHSLALAEDGTVFSWGRNEGGQIGLGRSGGNEALPQKVEALSGLKVYSVATAGSASCAVTAAGELFSWGNGRAGRLGHGDAADQLAPRRVEALQGERVVAVSASAFHVIAVTRGGSVFGWGDAEELGVLPTNADGGDGVCWSPCRYPQLSCARSP